MWELIQFRHSLSQRLLNPIKLAYMQVGHMTGSINSQSAFNQLLGQYANSPLAMEN